MPITLFSESENDFVSDLIPTGNIWLGLDDSEIESVFTAMDKSPFDNSHYTNWMPNEPSFDGIGAAYICSKRDCGSDEWDDKSIEETAHVICMSIVPGKRKSK